MTVKSKRIYVRQYITNLKQVQVIYGKNRYTELVQNFWRTS